MVRIYTLPLFALRPMYYTIRNFKKAFSDVILSRRAIHNMNTLYPDATPEELIAADNVCIICREEMTTASKKLPCNHIFHTSCLRSWFQRQQTCPTCRLNILRTPTNNNAGRQAAAQRQPPINPNPFLNPFLMNANQFQFNQANLGNLGNVAQQPEANNQAQRPQTGASGRNDQQTQPQGNVPPILFPPFPFLPFMPPPPLPPRNFTNLSVEELRMMEGNERENVEARIQCLRNIQVLLDAAVVMMQQYNSITTIPSRSSQNTGETSAAQSAGSGTSETITKTEEKEKPSVSVSAGASEDTEQVVAANKKNVDKQEGVESQPSTSKQSVADVTEVRSPQEEEIRRRRLQRFEQQNGE